MLPNLQKCASELVWEQENVTEGLEKVCKTLGCGVWNILTLTQGVKSVLQGVPVALTFPGELSLPGAITVCTQESPDPALECPWRSLQLQREAVTPPQPQPSLISLFTQMTQRKYQQPLKL